MGSLIGSITMTPVSLPMFMSVLLRPEPAVRCCLLDLHRDRSRVVRGDWIRSVLRRCHGSAVGHEGLPNDDRDHDLGPSGHPHVLRAFHVSRPTCKPIRSHLSSLSRGSCRPDPGCALGGGRRNVREGTGFGLAGPDFLPFRPPSGPARAILANSPMKLGARPPRRRGLRRRRTHHLAGSLPRPRRPTPQGTRAIYRLWVPDPGMWAQVDWGHGPEVCGRPTCLFCAWLTSSGFRVVVPWDRTLVTLSCIVAKLRRFVGAPPRGGVRSRTGGGSQGPFEAGPWPLRLPPTVVRASLI